VLALERDHGDTVPEGRWLCNLTRP
jgi:hypothetical protein